MLWLFCGLVSTPGSVVQGTGVALNSTLAGVGVNPAPGVFACLVYCAVMSLSPSVYLLSQLFNSQISVTSVCPGPVQTPLFKKGIHVDGKMIGDKVGSKELVQTVMNKAMRPER